MTSPYVLIYTGQKNYSRYILEPIYHGLKEQGFEVTLINKDQQIGAKGEAYKLNRSYLPKKPDAVVGFQVWWGDEFHLCNAAREHEIPVIMVNHGAMFIRNDLQSYKKSIYPASVACLWGEYDYRIWRSWNSSDDFVITGNPSYDMTVENWERPKGLPDKYALLLTPGLSLKRDDKGRRKEQQTELLYQSARELSKLIPVVAKTHPNANQTELLSQEFKVYSKAEDLLPLMHHASLIISNATSAFIPAIYWEKPIFIHNHDEEGYHFSSFRDDCSHIFNFKSDPYWSESLIEQAVKPCKEDYELFGGPADGKSVERIVKVIESQLKQEEVIC